MKSVEIEKIDFDPNNPRECFPGNEIDAMAESIRVYGMIAPLVVKTVTQNRKRRFQLVAGERRLRAAVKAGFKKVNVIVRDDLAHGEALALQLIENLQRKDLNTVEKARGLELLCRRAEDGGGGKTHREAAAMFGHKTCWATNLIRLLKLPQRWLAMVASGDVSESSARAMLKYVDAPDTLDAIANDLEANRWAYNTREDFERSAAVIAIETDGDAGSTKAVAPAPAARPRIAAAPSDDGGADVDDALEGDGIRMIDYLIGCIDDIQTLEEIDILRRAIIKRRFVLRSKTPAAEVGRAAG